MPKIIQYFTLFNPMRYFLVIIRGIFLKGIGIDILWAQALPLLVIGLVIITLSALKFRKSLG
jgi:ABC-2 type transport system permease protein